jgi:deazaflavin-dependent oxidoreductase (nitroreductase family)
MTHVGAKSGKTRSSALVYFTDRGRAILSATSFGGSRNLAWYHNVDANPFVTLYGRGIRGRFIAKESYDAERDRLFQRAKAAPAPQASTSRQRPPNPDAFLSLHLRRRAVGAPPLWSTLRRDWCGFDDLIDAQVTGFVQYPPTRDHDPVNPHATVVAIIERATKRMLAAR